MHCLLLGGMYMHVLLSVEPPGIGSIHVCFRLSDIVYRACIHVELKNFWGKKNVAAISDEEYKVPETPAYVIMYSKIIPLSYFTIWQLL